MKYLWIVVASLTLLLQGGCMSLNPPRKLDWQSPYKDISTLEEGQIVHLQTGEVVTKEQLMDISSCATIVYVGEAHDNLNAHKVQLEILQAFHERYPGNIAVGMEMLKRPSQDVADQWTAGEVDEKVFFKTWVDDWTNDYDYYRDILEFVREHHIPLRALRASDDWKKRVKALPNTDPSETNEVNGEALPEMDIEDTYHRSHIEAVFKKHPRHSQDFEEFYKIQVLWDESMAQSIHEYLVSEEGQDKKILIFAGSQHIEHGFGIPRRVFRRLPVPYVIVLPITMKAPSRGKHKTMKITLPEVPLIPGDFAWMVTHKDLDDKRVYLGVMVKETEEGIKIIGIAKESAAETAGLAKDDIIKTFDGEMIKASFDLTYLIGQKKPGDNGVVEVLRDGETLRYDVTFKTKVMTTE